MKVLMKEYIARQEEVTTDKWSSFCLIVANRRNETVSHCKSCLLYIKNLFKYINIYLMYLMCFYLKLNISFIVFVTYNNLISLI